MRNWWSGRAPGWSIVAFLGAVLGFLKPLLWIVEKLGAWDFFVYSKVGIGTFLMTGWSTLATVIVGAIIVIFALRQNPAESQTHCMEPAPQAGVPERACRPAVHLEGPGYIQPRAARDVRT